ncbi:MAG: sulfotransferase [Actinomycetota bacterium]
MTGRPILVTGSHRSGSTWVGKTLANAPEVGYIREPFGVHHRRGVLDVSFPHWFPYICEENERPYVRPMRDMLAYRYRTGAGLASARSPRDVALVVHDRAEFARFRRRAARPLLKDPIAVFSPEWIADRLDAQVIALIRHPAAFASSIKKYNWTHPFGDFLAQPLLMRDLLAPYAEEIERFAREPQEIVDQAILLWNLIHSAIATYRERRKEWFFARHEDLSREPVEGFRAMFGAVGVPFSAEIEQAIARSTGSENPAEVSDAGVLARDSRAGIWTWKARLSEAEIERVRTGTEPLWRAFYADDDW